MNSNDSDRAARARGARRERSSRSRTFSAALFICCILGIGVVSLPLLGFLALILAEGGFDFRRLFVLVGFILIGAVPLLLYLAIRASRRNK